MVDEKNLSDALLVRRCQKGDKRALKALYIRHWEALYAIVFRMTGQAADAEDVVQETFIRAWQALPSFRGEASFRNWLFRIGVNLAKNLCARKKKTVQLHDTPAPQNDADAMAQIWLSKAISQLPEGYKEVLVLHDVIELKHVEIAQVLGLSVGTSKSQLHRARAKMREKLLQSSGAISSPYASLRKKRFKK